LKKTIALFVFILTGIVGLSAQQRMVEGLVFDKDSRQRLTRVYIYSLGTHKGVFNNTKGEFKITVHPGDTLVAALEGYSVDTITVRRSPPSPHTLPCFFLSPSIFTPSKRRNKKKLCNTTRMTDHCRDADSAQSKFLTMSLLSREVRGEW